MDKKSCTLNWNHNPILSVFRPSIIFETTNRIEVFPKASSSSPRPQSLPLLFLCIAHSLLSLYRCQSHLWKDCRFIGPSPMLVDLSSYLHSFFSRWLQRGPAAVDETISQGGSTHKNGILICQSPRFFFLLCADMFSSVRRRKSRRYTKNTLFLGSLARNSDGRSCLFSASEGSETEWKPRF